jgi:hypothetical protein
VSLFCPVGGVSFHHQVEIPVRQFRLSPSVLFILIEKDR